MLQTVVVSATIGQPHVVSSICEDKPYGIIAAIRNPSIAGVNHAMDNQYCFPFFLGVAQVLKVINSVNLINVAIFCYDLMTFNVHSFIFDDFF